jgi:hypothetical protein
VTIDVGFPTLVWSVGSPCSARKKRSLGAIIHLPIFALPLTKQQLRHPQLLENVKQAIAKIVETTAKETRAA